MALGRNRDGSGAIPVVNTTFGALTKAGAGGVTVTGTSISSGDASGHWQISGGKITPSSTGDTANLSGGPYALVLDDGQEVNITVEADTYSVITSLEAQTAFTDAGATGGKTVKFRNISGGIDIGTTYHQFANATTYTSPMVLTGETGAKIYGDNGIAFRNCNNFQITGLDIQRTNNTVDAGAITLIGTCHDVDIIGNSIHGDYKDPLGDWASTLYENADGIKIASDGSTASWSGTIQNNLIYDVTEGIVIYATGTGGVSIIDNDIYFTYSDCIKIFPTGSALTAGMDISRNLLHDTIWAAGDLSGKYADCIQIISNAGNDGLDLTNLTIRQNLCWCSPLSNGLRMQGINAFTDAGYNVILKDPIIAGNVILTTSQDAIRLMAIDGGTYVNNVCCYPDPTLSLHQTPALGLGSASSAGTLKVYNNIVDNLVTAGTVDSENNTLTGARGVTIAYSTVFEGSSFYPASFAALQAEFATATAYDPRGAIGSGFQTIGNAVDSGTGWAVDTDFYVKPTISSSNPADNATDVAVDTNPTITFSQNIEFNTGNITLRDNDGGFADLEVFDVTTDIGGGAGTVSISSAVLTMEPTADFAGGIEHAIRIADGALLSVKTGLPFDGIADDTTLSFTSVSSNLYEWGDMATAAAWSCPAGMAVTGGVFNLSGSAAAFAAAYSNSNYFSTVTSDSADINVDFDVTRYVAGPWTFRMQLNFYDGPATTNTLLGTYQLNGSTFSVTGTGAYNYTVPAASVPAGTTHFRWQWVAITANPDFDIDNMVITQ